MPKQMNIFEDLIEELKEENLLEETVIDVQNKKHKGEIGDLPKQSQIEITPVRKEEKTSYVSAVSETLKTREEIIPNNFSQDFEAVETPNYVFEEPAIVVETNDVIPDVPQTLQAEFEGNDESFDSETEENTSAGDEEFFRKRATEEVTSLQMVQHVLSGIERNFLGITPKLYDDLEVKKALHNFLQNSENLNSSEQSNAETILLQETENWYSALSQKDKTISVDNLRRYCETTRPALSAQALIALARFYRNAPFSEAVRSKFEMAMTRLFARETGGDLRKLLFNREETIEKLNEFYAEWSSIPLYATEEDESNIVLSAIKFEEFATEASTAESIEELFKNDFFNRFKNFKDETHENFFAPLVTATSIESNVRIGNSCLRLLLAEKAKADFNADVFEENYAADYNEILSETICKTLDFPKVFAGEFADADAIWETQIEEGIQLEYEKQDLNKVVEKTQPKKVKSADKKKHFKANKRLIAATVLAIVVSLGLYMWAEYFSDQPKLSENVKTVNLDNSAFKEYVQNARINNDMFYGIVNVNWEGLTNEKKEDLLGKILMIGSEKGFKQVTLMNKQGSSVGYASAEKIEVYNP